MFEAEQLLSEESDGDAFCRDAALLGALGASDFDTFEVEQLPTSEQDAWLDVLTGLTPHQLSTTSGGLWVMETGMPEPEAPASERKKKGSKLPRRGAARAAAKNRKPSSGQSNL